MKKELIRNALVKFLSGLFLMGMLLFLPAGTIRFPGAWRLTALLFIPMLIFGIVLFAKAPELLKKRLNSKESSGVQKQVILLSALEFLACFVLAGLDFRFGWSKLPVWLIAVSSVLFVGSYGLYMEVMRENAYLSRTDEEQEAQKNITTR